ncbi:dual specificity tyrosine-phosphorylation-regulated kinase 2 [Encephalitozoon hellem]|nr:hypothetical protein GPU96_08g16580 [Encephalitozoon hellem]WEL39362.1 dual specificity tyrosine-phosphorylation-regulated kinase 2 [Encephalitozoon hellem]
MIEHGKNSSVFFEKENGYRFVGQPSSFTLEDMKKAIRSKDNMQEDDDVFIEFLLRALEPSHLVRPDARSLSAHSYLKIKDRGGDLCRAPSSRNGVQQSTLPSSKSIRHMSTTGVILPSKKQKPSDDRRKISVYGISYENNLNRDTE